MEIPIVEAQLQDICTFRQQILSSFLKINSKIPHVPTPLHLHSFCNCTQQNLPFDPFATYSFQGQPTHQSPQKINFCDHIKPEKILSQKTDKINKYLHDYDLKNFNFQVQPLGQRRNFNNQDNKFHKEHYFNNYLLLDKLNNSALQPTKQLLNQKLNAPKNRKTVSSHLNYSKNTQHSVKTLQKQQKKRQAEIKWRSQRKENLLSMKNNEQAQRSVKKHKQFCEPSKTNQIKNKVMSSKGFMSQRQGQNKKQKLSQKQLMRQDIYKRIKKRIYLSSIACKSARDDFDMIFNKQMKQRQDIVNKITDNLKVLKIHGL